MVNGKWTSHMIDLGCQFWMDEWEAVMVLLWLGVWNDAHGGDVLFCDEVVHTRQNN